jgi:hypothetical protein
MLPPTILMAGKWMSTDRNANGRFAAGWHGGPGRPRRTVEARYLTTLRESVPLETWGRICEAAVAQAVGGDAKAREWLSSYLIGKPLQAVEVEEPQGPRLSLWDLLAAIREAVPDPEAHVRIAAVLQRMGREAAGDDPGERPGPPRLSPPIAAAHELPQSRPNPYP